MIYKLAIGFASAATLGFTGVVGLLYTYQRELIYPVPEVDRAVPAGFQHISYATEDGLTLSAGYRPARPGMPTLLFFHGNSVDWQSTEHTTELAVARGYGVLAAEYRGYGGNPGTPSEAGLYADGRAALAWLQAQGVPLDHARQLAAANPAARLVTLPGVGHNMAGKVAAQVPQLAFLDALDR